MQNTLMFALLFLIAHIAVLYADLVVAGIIVIILMRARRLRRAAFRAHTFPIPFMHVGNYIREAVAAVAGKGRFT